MFPRAPVPLLAILSMLGTWCIVVVDEVDVGGDENGLLSSDVEGLLLLTAASCKSSGTVSSPKALGVGMKNLVLGPTPGFPAGREGDRNKCGGAAPSLWKVSTYLVIPMQELNSK